MQRFIEPNLNPPDYDDGVTELQEKIGVILEDEMFSAHCIDQIMKLIADEERAKFDPDGRHPETCGCYLCKPIAGQT